LSHTPHHTKSPLGSRGRDITGSRNEIIITQRLEIAFRRFYGSTVSLKALARGVRLW